MNDWKTLTDMTDDKEIVVESVAIKENGISIKGEFELPPLAKLSMDDQIFVAAFVKCHGSIKEMEKLFGVSYPTIKSRLKKIGNNLTQLDIEVDVDIDIDQGDILDLVSQGKISVEEALEIMKGQGN